MIVTILVIELVLIALGLATWCVLIAIQSRRAMGKMADDDQRQRNRLQVASKQLVSLKKHYSALQQQHQSTKEQLTSASAKAQYVHEVIKSLGEDSPVKSATTARAVLEAVVEGMANNTPPDKMATKVISAAFEQERGVPRKATPAYVNTPLG